MRLINLKEHSFFDCGFLDRKAVIVDLGACMGEFTIGFQKAFGGINASILVEANPTNFKKIPDDPCFYKFNKFATPNLGGKTVFYEDPASPYNGSATFEYFENKVTHLIENLSLREIINANNLSKIDILKIDIEGGEYDFFENIDLNDLNIVNQITVEFHDFLDASLKPRTLAIVEKLKKCGYSVVANATTYKNGSDHYDVLFYKNL